MIKNFILLLIFLTLIGCGGNDTRGEIETEKINIISPTTNAHSSPKYLRLKCLADKQLRKHR